MNLNCVFVINQKSGHGHFFWLRSNANKWAASARGQMLLYEPSPPDWVSESYFLEDTRDHAGFSSPVWLMSP